MFEVLIQLLPLLIGGAVAAFFGGLLGIGGGVIITPMMVWYLSAFTQIDEALIPRMAVATSLAVIAGTAATGCYTHHCVGRVDWRMVSRGWLPLAIGSFSGAWLISSVPHEIGIATVGIGLLVLGSLQIVDFSPKRVSNMGTPLVTGGAWGVGSISSYIGIGGGVLVVPLLRAVGYTMKDAIGTSSASSFVLAFAGTLSMVAIGLYENPGTEGALGERLLSGGAHHVAVRTLHQHPRRSLAQVLLRWACCGQSLWHCWSATHPIACTKRPSGWSRRC